MKIDFVDIILIVVDVFVITLSAILTRIGNKYNTLPFAISFIVAYVGAVKGLVNVSEIESIISGILFTVYSFFFFGFGIVLFRFAQSQEKNKQSINFSIVLTGIVIVITSSSLMNVLVYLYIPNQFSCIDSLSSGKIAFEFLYYIIMLSITYSCDSIQAVGTIAKVFQVLHICFFYFYLANIIPKLLDSKKESK